MPQCPAFDCGFDCGFEVAVPPTDITLTPQNVDENEPIGTTVGTLESDDPVPGDTFALVAGIGDSGNASFTIVGDELRTAEVFDHEAQDTYSVRIQVTNPYGLSFEKAFTITIDDVNEGPTEIYLSPSDIDENEVLGTLIGTFTVDDPDFGDIANFSFASGTGDDDNGSFALAGTTLEELRSNAVFDYETKDSYSIRIRATDTGALWMEKAFTITINDINEAPTDITLTSADIDENRAVGSVVGTFATEDPDIGDSHTYSLVAGTGDTDNASFNIVAHALTTAEIFDHETKDSYSIRVRSTDSGGLYFEKQFTITINDVNEAPTAVLLDNDSVEEQLLPGELVGTLSSVDPDVGDTHTYTFRNYSSYPDNNFFDIVGDELRTAAVFDVGVQDTYVIRIRSTDSGGLRKNQTFTITILPTGAGSPILTLSPQDVDEGLPIGTLVGTFNVTPGVPDPPYTYTLVSGTGDDDNGEFQISGDQLLTNVVLDTPFIGGDSREIRVRVTDNSGDFVERAFTITINNVLGPPLGIKITPNSIEENNPSPSVIGDLGELVDDDPTDLFFLVPATEECPDNALFWIAGHDVLTFEVFDYEAKSEYCLLVRIVRGAWEFTGPVIINILDVDEIGAKPGPGSGQGTRVLVIDQNSIYRNQLGEIRNTMDEEGRFRVHLDGTGRFRRTRQLPLLYRDQLKIDPRPSPYATEEPKSL